MDLPIGLGSSITERGQKQLPIRIITENHLEMIAAVHNVVNRSRILDTQLASHERQLMIIIALSTQLMVPKSARKNAASDIGGFWGVRARRWEGFSRDY
jgi:hypothetical protein